MSFFVKWVGILWGLLKINGWLVSIIFCIPNVVLCILSVHTTFEKLAKDYSGKKL